MKYFWLIVKWFLLIILWAVFPPAFFFISKDYGIKKWARWTFTILSPWGILAILFIILLVWEYTRPSSLDFEKVKFNTPEKVITELGFENLPKFSYVGNTTDTEFNWGNWSCLVEFQFEDSLSAKEKETIIQYAKSQDKFQWTYEGLPKEGVVEFFNIKYEENDTIPYNIVITNDKIYVAYNNWFYNPDLSDIFSSNDYHLLAERTWLIGPDSSHEYVVKFNQPYFHYINELKKDKTIEYKETSNTITIKKYIYAREDSTILQAEYEIEINKKKNTALINYGTF